MSCAGNSCTANNWLRDRILPTQSVEKCARSSKHDRAFARQGSRVVTILLALFVWSGALFKAGVLIAAAIFLAASSAEATTRTYDGGTGGTGTTLNTAANWSSDTVPTTSDEALFTTVPATASTFSVGNTSPTYGDLIWNQNTSSNITGSTGSRILTLSGGGGSTAAIAAGGASGDLLLLGTNATTNTLTIGSSTVSLAISANGQFNVVNTGATLNIAGVLTGNFNLTKTGAGTLTFSGAAANTYTGLTTVSAGELDLNKTAGINAIAGDGSTATTDITVNGGTLKWLADNQVGNTATIAISSGTVDLNGKTETIGTLMNSGGTFVTGVNGHLIGTTATIDWAGGTNTINAGGLVEDNHIKISGGTNMVEGKGVTSATTGGVLQLNSAGTGLEISNGADLVLQSDNVSAGTLKFNMSPGNVTVTGAADTATISSSGGGSIAGTVDLGANTRTFTVSDGTATTDFSISAQIINGGLTKAGAGTMELLGSNTYTSGTLVATNGGKLIAGATGALGSTSDVTVNSGGTLLLAGTGNLNRVNDSAGIMLAGGTLGISPTAGNPVHEGTGRSTTDGGATGTGTSTTGLGALTLQASSTLDFGSAGVGTLVFADFSRTAGILTITNWTSNASGPDGISGVDGTDDRLIFFGDQSSDLAFFSFDGVSAMQIALGDGYFELTPIPEPSTWAAGVLGFAALLAFQRRRISRLFKGA